MIEWFQTNWVALGLVILYAIKILEIISKWTKNTSDDSFVAKLKDFFKKIFQFED